MTDDQRTEVVRVSLTRLKSNPLLDENALIGALGRMTRAKRREALKNMSRRQREKILGPALKLLSEQENRDETSARRATPKGVATSGMHARAKLVYRILREGLAPSTTSMEPAERTRREKQASILTKKILVAVFPADLKKARAGAEKDAEMAVVLAAAEAEVAKDEPGLSRTDHTAAVAAKVGFSSRALERLEQRNRRR